VVSPLSLGALHHAIAAYSGQETRFSSTFGMLRQFILVGGAALVCTAAYESFKYWWNSVAKQSSPKEGQDPPKPPLHLPDSSQKSQASAAGDRLRKFVEISQRGLPK
jgi:hypothetical protein